MPHAPSPRLVFIGLVLLAVVSMLFARLYLQAFLNLEACPLCMTQRVFVVSWGLIALIAALHNPLGWGRRVYGGTVWAGRVRRRGRSSSTCVAATPPRRPGAGLRP